MDNELILARVARIDEIRVHPNADSLELAILGGWQVCVKKGEFKSDDLCVYCEVDTVLDYTLQPFNFLSKLNGRIRTIKLRGEFSQGICFPLDILNEFGTVLAESFYPSPFNEETKIKIEEGANLTSALKVLKYSKPEPNCQNAKGNFPLELISKTDETNLQGITSIIEELQGQDIDITIKEDGSSITVIALNDELRVCSRNLELKDEEGNKFWEAARKYTWPQGYTYQGELVGPGIQGNHGGYSDYKIKVFNIYDYKIQRYLDNYEVRMFCQAYGLDHVTLFFHGPSIWTSFKEFMEFAETARYENGHKAEGIVVRLYENEFHPRLRKPLSFKVVSNEYKLKFES